MADVIEKLSEALRQLPWPARASHLDEMVAESFGILRDGDPEMPLEDALRILLANYSAVIRHLDEGHISGPDEAMLNSVFCLDNRQTVELWLEEHGLDERIVAGWLLSHPNIGGLALLARHITPAQLH